MIDYTILYTNPILILVGILLIIFSTKVSLFMGKAFKNTARDANNPFVYKVIGVIFIITSVAGLIFFR